MFCTLAKYQKWIFQAWWVQSNIQTSIYHQYLISLKNPHELRWILIMIAAHTENLCEVKKKRCLRGTSNSHNPQLTWTSAQSEAALKVRGDASTYINHERSHHMKNSNAHKRHSAQCVSIFSSPFPHRGIHQIFPPGFSVFHDSSVYSFTRVCCFLSSKSGTGLCVQLFLTSSHLLVFVLYQKPFWVNIHLARRCKPLSSKTGWQSKKKKVKQTKNFDVYCWKIWTRNIFYDGRLRLLSQNFNALKI